jgi:hypothetical protein
MLLIIILLILAVGVSIEIDNSSVKDAKEEYCNIEC